MGSLYVPISRLIHRHLLRAAGLVAVLHSARFAPVDRSPNACPPLRSIHGGGCALFRRLRLRGSLRQHAEGALVEVEQALLLVVLVLVHLPDLDELAHDFRLEAGTLGFGINFLDVLAERTFFVLETFDALDERFQLRARDAADIRHDPPLPQLRCRRPRGGDRTIAAARSDLNASARLQTRPFARVTLPSGIWRAIRHRACRRQSSSIRGLTARCRAPRPRPDTISTDNCGKSRPGSSGRCFARRSARADARPGGGKSRPPVRCGSCRPLEPPFVAEPYVARGPARLKRYPRCAAARRRISSIVRSSLCVAMNQR